MNVLYCPLSPKPPNLPNSFWADIHQLSLHQHQVLVDYRLRACSTEPGNPRGSEEGQIDTSAFKMYCNITPLQ